MRWLNDGGLSIDPPKKTKKITGTRFGAVLGKSPWSTPFEMWCECTKTYEEPFEDTIYTKAGKTIEPKQIEYVGMFYDGVTTPTDVYGKDYFNQTHGDFFPQSRVFGGMWDALIKTDGKVDTVIEFKTTKRIEDWEKDIPEYYALQAALYGYLLCVDNVMMVCSILDDEDYINPDAYDVNKTNTFSRSFKISERYPNFEELISEAENWYMDYVVSGNSPVPDLDNKTDAEIVKILKTDNVDPDATIENLIGEWEELKMWLDNEEERIKKQKDRFDKLDKEIKSRIVVDTENGTRYKVKGNKYEITYSPSYTESVDKKALKDAGLDNYITKTITYRKSVKEIKE